MNSICIVNFIQTTNCRCIYKLYLHALNYELLDLLEMAMHKYTKFFISCLNNVTLTLLEEYIALLRAARLPGS